MADAALEIAKGKMAEITYKIGVAEAQISALRAEIASHAKEWEKLRQFVATWYELAGTQAPADIIKPVDNSLADGPDGKRTRPKNPDRERVVEMCLQIIQEEGHPMGRRGLFDALVERGVVIQGKDPEMVLSTMLWRSKDRIVRLPNYGYWPAGAPHEDARYWPELEELFGSAANEPEDGILSDEVD